MPERGELRCVKRLSRWRGHVRSHALAFPIGLRNWIDRLPRGNEDWEVIVETDTATGIGSAASCLTDRDRAFLRLEIISELFCCGEGELAGQNIDLFIDVAFARHI